MQPTRPCEVPMFAGAFEIIGLLICLMLMVFFDAVGHGDICCLFDADGHGEGDCRFDADGYFFVDNSFLC